MIAADEPDGARGAALHMHSILALFDPQSSVRMRLLSAEDVGASMLNISTRLSSQSTHHTALYVPVPFLLRHGILRHADAISPLVDVVVKAGDLQRVFSPASTATPLAIVRMTVETEHVLQRIDLVLHVSSNESLNDDDNGDAVEFRIKGHRDFGAEDLEIGIPTARARLGSMLAAQISRHLWPSSSITLSLRHEDSAYLDVHGESSSTCSLAMSVPVGLVSAPTQSVQIAVNGRQLKRLLAVGQHLHADSAEEESVLELGFAPGSALSIRLLSPPSLPAMASIIAAQLSDES